MFIHTALHESGFQSPGCRPSPATTRAPDELWLLDNANGLRLRCRSLNVGPTGVQLLIPSRPGVQTGRSVRLCSHLSGQTAPSGGIAALNRSATVTAIRTVAGDGAFMEVDLDYDSIAIERNPAEHSD